MKTEHEYDNIKKITKIKLCFIFILYFIICLFLCSLIFLFKIKNSNGIFIWSNFIDYVFVKYSLPISLINTIPFMLILLYQKKKLSKQKNNLER